MPSAYDGPAPAVPGVSAAVLEGAAIVAFVATTDLDRAHAFYGGVLGLFRTEASPFANAYEGGGATLRVTRVERLVPAPYTVLGWRVEALAVTLARLAGAGLRTRRFAGLDQDADGVWTAPGGARIAWFEDPDGNLLSLTESPPSTPPADRAGAPRTAPSRTPAQRSARSVTDPRDPAQRERAERDRASRDPRRGCGDPTRRAWHREDVACGAGASPGRSGARGSCHTTTTGRPEGRPVC